jgi:hypothetical protein
MAPEFDFKTLRKKQPSLTNAEGFHAIQVGLQHSTVCRFVYLMCPQSGTVLGADEA